MVMRLKMLVLSFILLASGACNRNALAGEATLTPREIALKHRLSEFTCKDGYDPKRCELEKTEFEDYLDQSMDDSSYSPDCSLDEETVKLFRATLYAANAIASAKDKFDNAEMPLGYHGIRAYSDDTGTRAGSFMSADGNTVIYSIAGTTVFGSFDIRSVIAGFMTFGEASSSGDLAMEIIRDAVSDAKQGRNVVISGQSQGGIVAQSIAYFVQLNLERAAWKEGYTLSPWHVRLITQGVIGAKQIIERQLALLRSRMPTQSSLEYDPNIAKRLDAVGYFFPDDEFARFGTYVGRRLAFPSSYAFSPDELTFTRQFGLGRLLGYDKKLEPHFLTALKRASRKGGFCKLQEVPDSELSANREFPNWLIDLGQACLDGIAALDSLESSSTDSEIRRFLDSINVRFLGDQSNSPTQTAGAFNPLVD